MDELLELLHGDDPDADGELWIDEIAWEPQALGDGGAIVRLEGRLQPGEGKPSRWTIRCAGVILYRFDGSWDGSLDRLRDLDHPLLRQFVDRHAQLFFNTSAERLDEVVGALWRAHREACGPWIDFDSYLRAERVQGRHGQIAEGPRWLLELYAATLEGFSTQTSMIGEREYLEWRGGEWRPRDRPPEALLLGTCFVVADSFTAKRR